MSAPEEPMKQRPDGVRVRVVGGPWPERRGLTGVIVPKLRHEYPWVGMLDSEAVVLLDDDPFDRGDGRDWSCVMPLSALAWEGNL